MVINKRLSTHWASDEEEEEEEEEEAGGMLLLVRTWEDIWSLH